MKRIGILGGLSWESTIEYYRLMNEAVKRQLGGSHSANLIIYSFDFHEVELLQHHGEWDKLTALMINEANNLKAAGAELIVIASNTMHLMADDMEKTTKLKVVHIVDATSEEIKKSKLNKVLLLGTEFTMSGDFYKGKLANQGIEVIIPNREDRQVIHQIIYNELILGIIKDDSKQKYCQIIEKLALQGCEGVILGCTEIPLLIKEEDVSIPVFDTSTIHCMAAINQALK